MHGTKWYGIGAAQNPDNVNETIYLDGLEDHVKFIRDEHDELSAFRILGNVSKTKKIYSEKDCEDSKQLRCWKYAQVPFLYAEGEFADSTDHPNAKSAAELLKFASRPEIGLNVGLSIDGGIIERQDDSGQVTEDKEKGKRLVRTLGTSVAFTIKPCNPKCKLFLENDLAKSDAAMEPPARYIEALKKSTALSSFNEIGGLDFMVLYKLKSLKKSLQDYLGGFTSTKCYHCNHTMRFFKSGELPNCCEKCHKQFSVSSIWKALKK